MVDVTDEEDQQPLLLQLQQEIRELNDKVRVCVTKAESQSMINRNLQDELHDLKDEVDKLEGNKLEMEREIYHLKENISTHTNQPNDGPSPPEALHSSIFGRNTTIDTNEGIDLDTFSLMITSHVSTRAWALGISTFAFQMILIVLIGFDQIKASSKSSLFNVPFMVTNDVRIGQLLAIIFVLVTQDDVTSSIRCLVFFWNHPRWSQILLARTDNDNTVRPSSSNDWIDDAACPNSESSVNWIIHIFVPNALKLLQGILVMIISSIITVQSDNIIDLLKDFTALMVLSHFDNILFRLAINGYLGRDLQRDTVKVRGIKIHQSVLLDDDSITSSTRSINTNDKGNLSYLPVILICIATSMVGFWLTIVINQENGTYFRLRYPNCTAPEERPAENMFALAKLHFGDGTCYGGPLNTFGCEFEDGDCVNFNAAFPLCKDNNLVDVQKLVGDGTCNEEFNTISCDNDGGDCCPYRMFPLDDIFKNGACNGGLLNTKLCSYDNGECIVFNQNHPDCPLEKLAEVQGSNEVILGDGICDSDIYLSKECGFEGGDCCPPNIYEDPRFGDRRCNGGLFNTRNCTHDNGDCATFNLDYPDCPLSKLAKFQGSDEVILGDGICDSDIYLYKECGFEGGDCCPPNIFDDPRFGDKQCNGGLFNTKNCTQDNGDCQEFNEKYPDCPTEEHSKVRGSDEVIFGDGICDSDIYLSEECGFEDGDCCPPDILGDLNLMVDTKEPVPIIAKYPHCPFADLLKDVHWEFRSHLDNRCLEIHNKLLGKDEVLNHPCGDLLGGDLLVRQHWIWQSDQSLRFVGGKIFGGQRCLRTDYSPDIGTLLTIEDCSIAGDDPFIWDLYTDSSIRPRNNSKACVGPSRTNFSKDFALIELNDCSDDLYKGWNISRVNL